MTRDTGTNKRAGWWLLTLAGILSIAAVILWQKASQDAENERITTAYSTAITGDPADEPEPNRTPALITLGAAGIAGYLAIILLTQPTWPGRPAAGRVEQKERADDQAVGEPQSVARLYVHELTWARMTPTWRLRVMEWRHRRRRSIPAPAEFAAWAAVRKALSERGVRLPDP